MKFRVSEDVEAPVGPTWTGFTDFASVEEDARGRGAEIARVGDWREARLGASWRGMVAVRGKTRPIEAKITVFAPGETLTVESRIGGMDSTYEVTFVPLSQDVTRVSVMLELRATTLSARLLLQTMKIARRRVMQRLEGAVVRQAQAVERTWRARSGA
ncbi:hypothetical protein N8I71_14920 [Roseibacterium sp. SDUM158016]|uniref:hypothetical protein n=1 Tax=Roseicyclus sediminis TaxID=2980997 RepID=UPI0021D0066A|nr:hypothetical protein [Roseibacterium sp. SDUM158016]MCU4654135.1 hypothetical protein [Roseibacterium sp. SDUM158016]